MRFPGLRHPRLMVCPQSFGQLLHPKLLSIPIPHLKELFRLFLFSLDQVAPSISLQDVHLGGEPKIPPFFLQRKYLLLWVSRVWIDLLRSPLDQTRYQRRFCLDKQFSPCLVYLR